LEDVVSCWHCDRSGCPGSNFGDCPELKIEVTQLSTAEIVLTSIEPETWDADAWYQALALIMAERAPA
jgi:hypothetical protein